ncbi:MAG: elongation factor G [Terriglobia bacterium]
MSDSSADGIRNVALAGHGGSGKTMLTEAMLFAAVAITRLGRIEDGTTTSDYDPDEIKRQMSISTALAPLKWADHKVNLLDSPGYADFVGEAMGALRAADLALIVVCGVSGVEVQTERVWQIAEERKLPRTIVISRLDKENSNFEAAVKTAEEAFPDAGLTVFQLPIGKEQDFEGVVDLVEMKAYKGPAGGRSEIEIPEDLETAAQSYHEKLVESAAETDDDLLEEYLETGDLKKEELREALQKGILDGSVTPVLCSSAVNSVGVDSVLDFLVGYGPSPTDRGGVTAHDPEGDEITVSPDAGNNLAALVFKTVTDPYIGRLNYFRVYSGTANSDSTLFNASRKEKERVGHLIQVQGKNQSDVKAVPAGDIGAAPKLHVTATGDTLCDEKHSVLLDPVQFPEPLYSVAIEPKTRGDEEKLSVSLAKLSEEDPTFRVKRNDETHETIASGLGDLHVEVIVGRLKRRFSVETTLSDPTIPYKETIRGKNKAQGKYKKQTGGRGQYGDAWLEIEPNRRGEGFEFIDKIVGGAIPKNYIPSVEKGVKEALEKGVVAGYPIVDVKVTVYDGSYHPVDSSDMAFKIAGSMALKQAATGAKPVLLEPIVDIEVVVPEDYMGDVIGDLSGRRGKIAGMDARGRNQVVKAQAPLGEVSHYASELRSITHGRGTFSMSFYEEVPPDVRAKIAAEAEKAAEK